MQFENILYTPLDAPPMPEFDLDDLYRWLEQSHARQDRLRKLIRRFTSENNQQLGEYPWDISIAWFNMTGRGPGWMEGFQERFPGLADHINSCFGIPMEQFGAVIMLPMKSNTEGAGFYHQDNDWYGLRMYLEFEDYDNNDLLIRPTKEPYDQQTMIETPVDLSLLQDREIKAKILDRRQCWYVNNVRACHSTYVRVPGKRRIAVLLVSRFTNFDLVFPKIKELVMRSAEKYPDYVIEWRPENENR